MRNYKIAILSIVERIINYAVVNHTVLQSQLQWRQKVSYCICYSLPLEYKVQEDRARLTTSTEFIQIFKDTRSFKKRVSPFSEYPKHNRDRCGSFNRREEQVLRVRDIIQKTVNTRYVN